MTLFPVDNMLVTQTRLILLDSMLVFFMVCSIFSYVKFAKTRNVYVLGKDVARRGLSFIMVQRIRKSLSGVNELIALSLFQSIFSPFSFQWWFWLVATGLSIGLTMR